MKTIKLSLTIVTTLLTVACTNPSEKKEKSITEKVSNEDSLKQDTNSIQQQNAFATNAAIGGLMEVESSARLIKSTENPNVQTLATIMVKDHDAANKELTNIARKLKLQLPTVLPQEKTDILKKMEPLKEDEKNLFYADLMVSEHKQAVALFENGSKSEQGELGKFATKYLPKLKHHLMEAEHVQKILHSIKKDKGDLPLKISKSNQ